MTEKKPTQALTAKVLNSTKNLQELLDLPAVRAQCIRNYELTKRDGRGELIFERERVLFLKTVNDNPKLQECTRLSVYTAMIQLLASGLSLNEQQCAIVPRKGVAYWQPMYKGRIEQMMDNPEVVWVNQPVCVYEGDDFEYEMGEEPKIIRHRPQRDNKGKPLTHVYLIIEYKHGKKMYIMTKEEVHNVRSYSERYKYNPEKSAWTTSEPEMWKKSIIHRVYKTFPKNARMKALDAVLDKQPDLEEEAITEDVDYGLVDEEGNDMEPTSEAEVVEAKEVQEAQVRDDPAEGDIF
jgi:phage RecT family recombinase